MIVLNNKKKNILLIGILILFFVLSSNVFAAEGGLVHCGGEGDPCEIGDLFTLFYTVINFLLEKIVPLAGAVLLGFGAFFFLTAADDQGRIQKGKDIIKATAIGLVLVYSARFVILTLISLLTNQS